MNQNGHIDPFQTKAKSTKISLVDLPEQNSSTGRDTKIPEFQKHPPNNPIKNKNITSIFTKNQITAAKNSQKPDLPQTH